MKLTIVLALALALSGVLSGCESPSETHLKMQRQRLAISYRDMSKPLAERVAAFDSLVNSFKDGTPRTVLDNYFPDPVEGFTVRLEENYPRFELDLKAPDGSMRWIPLKGDLNEEMVVDYQ